MPEEEAEYYEEEFKQGRIIVTVRANGRYDEARDTLQRFGAYDIHSELEGGQPRPADRSTISRSRDTERVDDDVTTARAKVRKRGDAGVSDRDREIRDR